MDLSLSLMAIRLLLIFIMNTSIKTCTLHRLGNLIITVHFESVMQPELSQSGNWINSKLLLNENKQYLGLEYELNLNFKARQRSDRTVKF